MSVTSVFRVSPASAAIPPRWATLRSFFDCLLSPLVEAGVGGHVLLESGGPDGQKWTRLRALQIAILQDDPGLSAARAVAGLCGATAAHSCPGPDGQRGAGIYYTVSSFGKPHRKDANVLALAVLGLDIDAKSVGGPEGVEHRVRQAPVPTALVRSGGGVQLVYVLNKAIVFDRSDEARLRAQVGEYLPVSCGLEAASGSDEVWWPSHLFRCPSTYWVKRDPSVLVGLEGFDPGRRFDLADLGRFRAPDSQDLARKTDALVARLLGKPVSAPTRKGRSAVPLRPDPPANCSGCRLPARVSAETVRLLNTGFHPRYANSDGTIDRSRAVFGACLSLLGAGLSEESVATAITWSALRGALDKRGAAAGRWLEHQIAAARQYLAAKGGSR